MCNFERCLRCQVVWRWAPSSPCFAFDLLHWRPPFTPIGHFLNESQSDKHMAHTLPHPAGIVLVPSPTPTSIAIRIPFRSPMDGSGSSTWPVLWRRPVALAGKLQLIPKLRMKSNCSLAHSVVLRSALPPTLPPLPPPTLPSPVPVCVLCCPFLFLYFVNCWLQQLFGSRLPHRCWRGESTHPPPHLATSTALEVHSAWYLSCV